MQMGSGARFCYYAVGAGEGARREFVIEQHIVRGKKHRGAGFADVLQKFHDLG